MLSALDKENFLAFKFNIEISDIIEKISAPLFTNFKITNFGFVKIFNNGTMLRLSTGKEWTKKYFENQYYNDNIFYDFNDIAENSQKIKVSTNEPSGGVYSALFDHNIWNIFTLYERTPQGRQVWFFATDKNNTEMVNFYFNRLNVLQDFMKYFTKSASSLLIPESNNLIRTELNLTNQKHVEEMRIKKFLREIGKSEKTSTYPLSSRELECIQHIIMGKSAKETAQCLNISFRTVEAHLNNIKQKTGCKKLSALIRFVFEKNLTNAPVLHGK